MQPWLLALVLATQQQVWRPHDRVLITAFNDVGAITRDERRVYMASPGAISIYDFIAGRWELPLTLEDGVPPFDLPTAAAYEPVLSEVWIGTRGGLVYRYRNVPFRVEVVTAGLGSVQALVALPNIDDFVYARTSVGWFRMRRSSFSAQPISTPPAEIAHAAATRLTLDPLLRAYTAVLGLDASGQRWPVTSFVPDERPERFWFGTRGGGMFYFDPLRQTSDWHWFGAASETVTALAATAQHVWFGSDGRGPRYGLARGTHDLQNWEFHDMRAGAPRAAVNDLLTRGDEVWAATRDGVYLYQQRKWSRIGSGEAESLAASAAGVWGSASDQVFELSGTRPRVIVRAASIQRVRVIRDSLWILADRAILRHHPGDTLWVRAQDPPASEVLIDVGARGDSTFLLTTGALHVHDGSTWSAAQPWTRTANLGRLRSLTITSDAVLIAGDRGAARWSAGNVEVLRVPQDIPVGPVFQIVESGNYTWYATPAGALRIERRR